MSAFADRSGQGRCRGVHGAPAPTAASGNSARFVILRGPWRARPRRMRAAPKDLAGWRTSAAARTDDGGPDPDARQASGTGEKILRSAPGCVHGGRSRGASLRKTKVGADVVKRRSSPLQFSPSPATAGAGGPGGGGPRRASGTPPPCRICDPPSPRGTSGEGPGEGRAAAGASHPHPDKVESYHGTQPRADDITIPLIA